MDVMNQTAAIPAEAQAQARRSIAPGPRSLFPDVPSGTLGPGSPPHFVLRRPG